VKVYALEDLTPLLNKSAVIDAVRHALIAHAQGKVQSPLPGHLLFEEANGDCHIKYGKMDGSATFAIKVATGFYNNGARGLPVNNGLIMVFDAVTGQPLTLFQDEGWLTAWRTAAATALAAHILAPRPDAWIGVIGTGLQGQLAVEWIAEMIPDASFALHGRDVARTRRVAGNLGITSCDTIEGLLATSDIIITATPSAHPLFDASLARSGMHFVGVGADGPEKHELPTELFARATQILTDDHRQCVALGDFGRAVQAGQIDKAADISLGSVLSGAPPKRGDTEITIVDLTGIAAQDIAIANVFAQLLSSA
jgi:ornithine cyclodeaminase